MDECHLTINRAWILPRSRTGVAGGSIIREVNSEQLSENLGLLIRNRTVSLRDLAEEPWCVAHESAASRQAFDRVAQAAGFKPHIFLESNYFRAIGAAVDPNDI